MNKLFRTLKLYSPSVLKRWGALSKMNDEWEVRGKMIGRIEAHNEIYTKLRNYKNDSIRSFLGYDE